MNLKQLIKTFTALTIVSLTACSSEPNNYASLIEEYESEMAKVGAEKAIALASSLHLQPSTWVSLPSFMSGPIPVHYKAYHQGLGIDVSKLNYTQAEWLSEIKADDRKVAEFNKANPPQEDGHNH